MRFASTLDLFWSHCLRILNYIVAVVAIALCSWPLINKILPPKSNPEVYLASSSIYSNAVLIPNPEIENIYLYLVFPSGEALNPFDEGMAHYVEHLAWLSAFENTREFKNSHSNAWTNLFSTGYWLKTTESDLNSDLQRLLSVSSPLRVETDFALQERDIVLREYDYRFAEQPLYPIIRDMDTALYGKGTLARSVIGEPPIIAQYSLDIAEELHRESHVLSEATLLVYGNMTESRFESTLASLPGAAGSKPVADGSTSGWVEDGLIIDRDSLSLTNLSADTYIYRKLTPFVSCDAPVQCLMLLQIVENVLNSSLPGGLAGPLKFEQFVARSFSLHIELIANKYVEISVTAYPDNDISLDELENTFKSTLLETLETGLTQETFERVLARIEGGLNSVIDRDRPSYNLDLVLGQLMSGRTIHSLSDQKNALKNIRLEDVNILLDSLLNEGREVTRLINAKG